MKAIHKLNDTLKYNINVNTRNIIAAICVQEFYKLRQYATNHIDDELLDRLTKQAKRQMYSKIPMKMFFN